MKKALLAVLLAAAFVLAGCTPGSDTPSPSATDIPPLTAPMFEDRDEVFALYDEVTFDDSLETLTQRYGEPTIESTQNGDTYFWRTETSGVAIVFFDNGRIRSKLVDFEDVRQFGRLSQATRLDNVLNLNNEVTIDDLNMVMGADGLEFIRIAQSSSTNPEFSVGYLWANEEGENVKVLFNRKGKLDQISFTLN